MPLVTVDLADLETLVMTTGALKVIEGAISQRKSDPFVREQLDFTAAHDRLASAMRNARRAEAGTLVPWDGELDDAEVRALKRIDRGVVDKITGYEKQRDGEYDRLAAKGCIKVGVPVTGVVWGGEKLPEFVAEPGYAVKITDRGREKLAKLDAKKAADICGND